MGEALETRIGRLLAGRAIVMVGMMGAGKSSVGRRLAMRLGEAYFRDGERRVIRRLLDGAPKVLATGGGAFMQPETRAAIKQNAISIWLKADRDLILSRVRRRSNRPLLKTP